MTVPRTFEARLLQPIERELDAYVRLLGGGAAIARLELLESVSAELGGFSLREYRRRVPAERQVSPDDLRSAAQRLAGRIRGLPMPPALALSALCQEALDSIDRRRSGSYYTDFRLAQYLAAHVVDEAQGTAIVLDPACGSGILLGAYAHAAATRGAGEINDILARRIRAVDLSPHALRSTLLALSSMTTDLDVVTELSAHVRVADSLRAELGFWTDLSPDGFNVVLGNPPWEKVKLSRHELLRRAGVDRHYGATYAHGSLLDADLEAERRRLKSYLVELNRGFDHQGRGESDLYKLFLELAFKLVTAAGRVGLIVPAGLIRSHGAAGLRSLVLQSSEEARVALLDNRPAFFSIDTRFKFVVLTCRVGPGRREPVQLVHATADATAVTDKSRAELGRRTLGVVRPDLSIPEVRSHREWKLFQRMMGEGWRLDDSVGPWRMSFAREVDMTNDREHFAIAQRPGDLPIAEGRMVHQFRFGVKAYVAGTGRRATWIVLPVGGERIEPQYWISPSALSHEARERATRTRLGFCDITGQTNERSMLAALIPPNVVCGNKVPTVDLDVAAEDKARAYALWLAFANSLPFDWLLRRVVTTSVNYFLLRTLAFPPMWVDDLRAERIVRLVNRLGTHDRSAPGPDLWHLGDARAEIDARVALAWRLQLEDVDLLVWDFPLLDRGEPPLPGEDRSTVTADLFRLKFADLMAGPSSVIARLHDRVAHAKRLGAIPYRPSEQVRREAAQLAPEMESASGS